MSVFTGSVQISPGQFLFFAKRPIFVQQEIHGETENIVDDRHRFLGDAAYMDPQKGKEAAQADSRDTVNHIDFHEGFFPWCPGCTEHIAPIKEEGPGHTEDKAEKQGHQEINTGKPPQALQTPQHQIINAQIHQSAAEAHQRK